MMTIATSKYLKTKFPPKTHSTFNKTSPNLHKMMQINVSILTTDSSCQSNNTIYELEGRTLSPRVTNNPEQAKRWKGRRASSNTRYSACIMRTTFEMHAFEYAIRQRRLICLVLNGLHRKNLINKCRSESSIRMILGGTQIKCKTAKSTRTSMNPKNSSL